MGKKKWIDVETPSGLLTYNCPGKKCGEPVWAMQEVLDIDGPVRCENCNLMYRMIQLQGARLLIEVIK